MLAALRQTDEVAIYARGALTCGATVEEIQEVLLQATAYCGGPAGRQAFLAADRALRAAGVI
jgi:4-carboxymuconolactone decarboxylase